MIVHRCKCSGRLDAATPQQIMDDMEIDVFGEIITLTRSESEWLAEYKAALWHRYRYSYIANCDLEYWEQNFADKMALLIPKYDAFMTKFNATDLTDLEYASGSVQIDHTAIPGTVGDKSVNRRTAIAGTDGDVTEVTRTAIAGTDGDVTEVKHTAIAGTQGDITEVKHAPNAGTDGDVTDTEHTAMPGTDGDESRIEHEVFPITSVGTGRYLSDATTTKNNPNTRDHVEHKPNTTDTTKYTPNTADATSYKPNTSEVTKHSPNIEDTSEYTPNTRDKTEYHDYQDINAATFAAMMSSYDSPLLRFIEEFSGFFLNRW